MTKIIAIVGMCGAGKSILADELVNLGWGFVRFGQITLDIAKERNVSGEAAEKQIREEIRAKHGMGAFATLNIPKFDAVLVQKNLVADGLYSWSEYKILKEYYGDRLTVIAVYAPPALRYERISKRHSDAADTALRNRNFTAEEARTRDFAEIENIEKAGPIAMADFTIINTGTMDDFKKEIKKFIKIYEN
jgi:dephospho-CoA kinase